MHALKDNLKLNNEVEQLSKITKEKEDQIKKLVIEMEEQRKEMARLKEAFDEQSSFKK